MKSDVKTALVGTGGIAGIHMSAVGRLSGRLRVAAAADVDQSRAEAFCSEHGIPRSYTNFDRMLSEERPDLVLVCTPPSTHRDLVVAALEAGAWVICEKPLCGSLAELDDISAAEEQTGNYCASVFQWRFGAGAQHLKRLIRTGDMGRPLVGITQTTWYRNQAYYDVPWRGRWETELGGVTMGHGIHAMDLLLWLLEDWSEVRADAATLDRDIEVEDVSMAVVRFESGAMASVVNSVLSPREESYLRLDFQRCTVELRHLYGYSNLDWRYTSPGGLAEPENLDRWRRLPEDEPSLHAAQFAATLEAMSRNERPPASGPDVRRTIEFIAALYKSAATRRPVSRGEIDECDPFYHAMNGSGVRVEARRG